MRILTTFENRNFRIYATANGVSLTGYWMQQIGIGWLAWQLTESTAWVGAVASVSLVPSLILAPFAGVAADRWDRLFLNKLSQSCHALHALALFILTSLELVTPQLLLILGLISGAIASFNQPVRLALIPSLVRREDLSSATAVTSIIFNTARFIGPAAAAGVIAVGRLSAVFALSFFAILSFRLALSRIRPTPEARTTTGPPRHVFAQIAAGFRYAARHDGIAAMLLLMLVSCVGAQPFSELLPAFAGGVFNQGVAALSVMTSSLGLGALTTALWLANRGRGEGLTRIGLLAFAVLPAILLVFVQVRSLWLAVPLLFIAGGSVTASNVGTQTLMQLSVDPAMRGRVLSTYSLINRGGPALGAFGIGYASEYAGLAWTVAVGAVVTLLVWLAIWPNRRRLAATLELRAAPHSQPAAPS
ncbi:MAG: MFS transporter [Proteobacteria bacterium]|nr:MFS transporter [Pseudomonadota bacterium]